MVPLFVSILQDALTLRILISICLCQIPGDGLTPTTAGYSCKTILHYYPESPSGVYYINMGGDGTPYQAGCDMETDGGGWTLVWSNIGGFAELNTTRTNEELINSEIQNDIITPSTFGSYINAPLYWYASSLQHTEWIKLMRLYKTQNIEQPIHKQSIRVEFGSNRFWNVFDPTEPFCNFFEFETVSVYLNGVFRGEASLINHDPESSYGLGTNLTFDDMCFGDGEYITDGNGIYRIDGKDPLYTYKHLFSYHHNVQGQQQPILNSMCAYSCWDENTYGYADAFIWGFREDCNINNCSCIGRAMGPACEIPVCFGYAFNDTQVCSSNGECIAPNTCKCNDGYAGKKCDIPVCFGFAATDQRACSGHGICEYPDSCNCTTPGYEGSQCEFPVCFGRSMVRQRLGFQQVCNGNGICVAPDRCECTPGFSGITCNETSCINGGCNGKHQVCNVTTGMCECEQGWLEPSCELCNPEFFCSSHGYCLEDFDGTPSCKCIAGYFGPSCNSTITSIRTSLPRSVDTYINTGTTIIVIGAAGVVGTAGTSILTLSFCAPALVPLIEIGLSALFSYFQSLSVIVLRNDRLKELSSDGVFKIFHLFNFDIAEALKPPTPLSNTTIVANDTYVDLDKITQKKDVYAWYEVNGMVVIKIIAFVLIVILWYIPYLICYSLKDKYPKMLKIGFMLKSNIFTVLYSFCLIPVTSSLLQQLSSPSVDSFTLPGAIIVSIISAILLLVLTIWLVFQFWKHIVVYKEFQQVNKQNIELEEIQQDQNNGHPKAKILTRSWKQVLRWIFFPVSELISIPLSYLLKSKLITAGQMFSKIDQSTLLQLPVDENQKPKSVFDATLQNYIEESKLREVDALLLRKTLWLILAFSLSSFPIAQIVVVLVFQLYYVCFYTVHAPHKTWTLYLSNILKEVIMLIQLCIMLDIVINIEHAAVGLIVSVTLNILLIVVTVVLLIEKIIRAIIVTVKNKKKVENK